MDRKYLKPRQWRLIQIESAIACNLKCVMCPWQGIDKNARNRGIMPPEIWAAIRPHLPNIAAIDFTGGGEPLLQPHLIEWLAEAAPAGCNTGFLSNGVLLNENIAKELIDTGINWIGISIDGASAGTYEQIRIGSNFAKVCTNVSNIARLRIGTTPKLMINFVLMSTNFHEVGKIIELASDLGVDQVNFKQCDVIRGEHGKGWGLFSNQRTKDIKKMEKSLLRARRKAKNFGIQTTSFSFTPREKPVCDQDPRNSMFIRYDGSVGPCINLAVGGATIFLEKDVIMPKVKYGQLPHQNLTDLWETKMCRYFKNTFSSRVSAHEKAIISSFIGIASRRKVDDEVRRTMPKASKGCQVCHYLYDI